MRSAVATALLAATLIGASAAQAAQRYAAPGGTGTGCSKSSPCSLAQAIARSSANDEVIVTGGTYTVGSTIYVPGGANNVFIHGEFGGPRPRIEAALTNLSPIGFSAFGARLNFLEIVNRTATSPVATYCPPQGEVDRVSAIAVGANAVGSFHYADRCEIRNSFIRADGSNATALSARLSSGTSTGSARNVTAVATGVGAIGISSYFNGGDAGSFTLNLTNSIASGSRVDLQAAGGSRGPGNIVVSSSNFDQSQEFNGGRIVASNNQSLPPLFVDATGGDYREALGSPTIDAGSNVGVGPLDLDGNPRVIGAAPDIGAYEYSPPVITPPPLGKLLSLTLAPRVFKAVNAGGPIFGQASRRRQRKRRFKVGSIVRYVLSDAAIVRFVVQRRKVGRRVKGKCRKATRGNRKRRRCVRWLNQVRFARSGGEGKNRFRFSGRGRRGRLRPGRYRLVGRNSRSVERAYFRIVR